MDEQDDDTHAVVSILGWDSEPTKLCRQADVQTEFNLDTISTILLGKVRN